MQRKSEKETLNDQKVHCVVNQTIGEEEEILQQISGIIVTKIRRANRIHIICWRSIFGAAEKLWIEKKDESHGLTHTSSNRDKSFKGRTVWVPKIIYRRDLTEQKGAVIFRRIQTGL